MGLFYFLFLDDPCRFVHRGQGAVAQQIDLYQADVLGRILIELGNDNSLGGPLQGNIILDGPGGDDDAARVDRQVVRPAPP